MAIKQITQKILEIDSNPAKFTEADILAFFDQICAEFANFKPREKAELAPRCFFIVKHIQKSQEYTPSELKNVIDNLKLVSKYTFREPSIYKAKLAKLTLKWLQATGNSTFTLLDKQRSSCNVESGTIGISDLSFVLKYEDDKSLLKDLNDGNALVVGVGRDGKIGFEARIIEAKEPILEPKEYGKIIGSTEVAILKFPTGEILVADLITREIPKKILKCKPGNYKVVIFQLEIGYNKKLIFVLSPTKEKAENNITELVQLEL